MLNREIENRKGSQALRRCPYLAKTLEEVELMTYIKVWKNDIEIDRDKRVNQKERVRLERLSVM